MSLKLAILLALIGLIASSHVKAEVELDDLYNKLFSKDATALDPSETLTLLEQVNLLKGNADKVKHPFVETALEKLIDGAKNIDDSGCSGEKFAETYNFDPTLSEIPNIKAFIQLNQINQLNHCRDALIKDLDSLEPEVKTFFQKYYELVGESRDIATDLSLIEPVGRYLLNDVAAKRGKKLLAGSLQKSLDKRFVKFRLNCELINQATKDHSNLFIWGNTSFLYTTLMSKDYKEWFYKARICSLIEPAKFNLTSGETIDNFRTNVNKYIKRSTVKFLGVASFD